MYLFNNSSLLLSIFRRILLNSVIVVIVGVTVTDWKKHRRYCHGLEETTALLSFYKYLLTVITKIKFKYKIQTASVYHS